jgi:probable F420-dependent oxidoreductase
MRFMLEYPLHTDRSGTAWSDPDRMAEFAEVAEESGVDAIALTDHPAPSRKWLERGGHMTLDPFVGLTYFAAVTTRVRLMTSLCVLPYRNPFITAKAMTALDILSKGRAIFVLGTGYLRSEFAAVGVSFEERNEIFDEAVEVLHGVWSNQEYRHEGKHFSAFGVTMEPGPVQKPRPPLWLGGNAAIVRRRVAAWGDGWQPLLGGSPEFTATTRTRAISTDEEFAALIAEIKDNMAKAGRDPTALEVGSGNSTRLSGDDSVGQHLDRLGRLADMGVTWSAFPFPTHDFRAALDGLRQYGETVASKAR